jgi:hypothetical protein
LRGRRRRRDRLGDAAVIGFSWWWRTVGPLAQLGMAAKHEVATEREERASIAVGSNSAFSEWARTFTDPRLCAAIVDRITLEAHIIETGTDSYRLRTSRHKRT